MVKILVLLVVVAVVVATVWRLGLPKQEPRGPGCMDDHDRGGDGGGGG